MVPAKHLPKVAALAWIVWSVGLTVWLWSNAGPTEARILVVAVVWPGPLFAAWVAFRWLPSQR